MKHMHANAAPEKKVPRRKGVVAGANPRRDHYRAVAKPPGFDSPSVVTPKSVRYRLSPGNRASNAFIVATVSACSDFAAKFVSCFGSFTKSSSMAPPSPRSHSA